MKYRGVKLLLSNGILSILLGLSLAPGAGAHEHIEPVESPHRHVIVDTDMGLDDVRAVFALLADSTLEIKAIVTVAGSAAPGKGTDNLVGLLEASHSGSIPVIRGDERAGLPPPAWRQTANSLAGAAFPPPRQTDVVDFTAEVLGAIVERDPGVQYLALGPLSNLRALLTADPASYRLIDTIYIPAVVRNGNVSDYNFTYDAQASESILGSDARVVIIDISGVQEISGLDFLHSLEGESLPVLWIDRLLAGLGDETGHIMMYDDLAVAAFLRGALLEFDDSAYGAQRTAGDGFVLTPAADGNIRLGRLVDIESALATLRHLYSRGPMERPPHDGAQEIPAETLLRAFHGHLGPYVVIGYRMGKLALKELNTEGHFGISAEVHSPLQTPRSCLIDGVQIGSGCTLGKGNIAVAEAPEPAWVLFTSAEGERVTIRLRPEIPSLVEGLVNSRGVETAGRAFSEIQLDSLFTIEGRGD